jgi:hypothetical protein
MFESNTVFVIGAGASAEAGLPIGASLTKKIAELVKLSANFGTVQSGDHEIYQALTTLTQKEPNFRQNKFLNSGRAVAEAMDLALSIDTFLQTHASNDEFVKLGKLGIVRAIAIEEGKSLLAPSQDRMKPFKLVKLSDTWYYSLARQLFNGVPAENPELAFANVSFIVFNYDRCLQTFLVRALQVYFRISADKAGSIVQNIQIVHPYGSLGSIFSGDDHVPFAPERLDLLRAAERIKTFSESAESIVIQRARDWVERAKTLVFLGFGFHEQNMDFLHPNQLLNIDFGEPFEYRAFATTYGLSDSDADVVADLISYLRTGGTDSPLNPWIHTHNGSCADLFRSYWRSLTR